MKLENMTVNVLGDSITYGVGTSDPAHTCHGVLAAATGIREVRNYGISGTRIARQIPPDIYCCDAAFVDRYTGMAEEADLVLVFGGTNDYGHGNAPFGTMADRTEETFCGACHRLFAGLIARYPSARIVVMTPMQREGGSVPCPNTGLPLLAYVDALREIAGQYSLPVLDLYREAGICVDDPAQRELYCPDGLHPNDAGAARIASRLEAFLRAL